LPSGGLNTTLVALATDVVVDGAPVVGYGFTSFGRFGQEGLIRERFGPRLMAASFDDGLDPLAAWAAMMAGEKPGGHGERCVAVGALDMAVWDAAAKCAGLPLYRYLARRLGRAEPAGSVAVYAGGGYDYPTDDLRRLADECRALLDLGYTQIKIKIAAQPLAADLRRIETVLALLPGGQHLAVDAMNRYSPDAALAAGRALAGYGLRWFEDFCDPLDFDAHAALAAEYGPPLAAGEALFSLADARNLLRYGGLRPERDVLLFDPAHTYGLPEYSRIVDLYEAAGWPRSAFQPHGGHLFSLHVAAALGLGGSEANPLSFQPFGGFSDELPVAGGRATLPQAPGIGFETRAGVGKLFREVAGATT
jgi:L-alanine-DL-glutamate epimerase-like enolase superfamily enzyme